MWIAFKNYYLRDEGQPSLWNSASIGGCELLSKIIIFVMKDNKIFEIESSKSVVNCFQKLLSSWWRTTKRSIRRFIRQLWIAFKNYYLRDEGQRICFLKDLSISCELLSKIIIFVMKDNRKGSGRVNQTVVNCFQKLLSSWWRTTEQVTTELLPSLWIAFKNYYLRDEGQLLF